MENERWPVKLQQSGAAGADNLNNGNTENGDGESLLQNAGIKDEPENCCEVAGEIKMENAPAVGTISEKSKQTIRIILDQIKSLSQIEKFMLYLKLPAEISNVVDPFRQPLNPLGSRSEIARTICWIQTHLIEDPDVSLPKQEVYNEYFQYCDKNNIKPLSQADFGKVMKQVYPKVRARRLGTRGNSRYCYSGLRRCVNLRPPTLPDLGDKPMSTEAPFAHPSVASAAWLIVRDWSQQQLGVQFASLQALAYYLILNHSIGAGTEAASKLTSATETKNEEQNCKSGNKHREMQLQLQRKIQQKNEGKDRKRKTPAVKSDSKPAAKKSRSASVPAPSRPGSPVPPTSGSCSAASSASASPTQVRPVCDTQPTLPDFNSFQRPAATEASCTTGVAMDAKVAIPRLTSCPPVVPAKRKLKYKMIQPRLQTCDTATYKQPPPDATGAEQRSQTDGGDGDCDDVPDDFPLTRERLDSISNVAKDAMDEYLGTNNSQHEEELSKYFSNTDVAHNDVDNTTKLSTLRQLLEQNGISDNKPPAIDALITNTPAIPDNISSSSSSFPDPNLVTVQTTGGMYALPHVSSNVRRRVSFETPAIEDTVPPSPNTRRKNFSFTPISPGPQSPNSSVQSKGSSANVSPFVSPRNTPIPRTKNTIHQNAGIAVIENRKCLKVKREIDLSLDLTKNYAPVTPMLNNNNSVLQKLLNANSKVQYSPGYNTSSQNLPEQQQQSSVNHFFPEIACRSQSVPLQQMVPTEGTFITDQDFVDADPIVESDSDKVKRIINSLDETTANDNNNIDMFNIDLSSTNQCLPEFGLNLINTPEFTAGELHFVGQRNTTRSHSIDVGVGFADVKCNPSRSVPNTPLPLVNVKTHPVKDFTGQSSRSYPSTPLNSDAAFIYNVNGDCLLNGQPIRSDDIEFLPEFEMNGTNNINQEKVFQLEGDFGDSLIDDSCMLMHQNYNGNIN